MNADKFRDLLDLMSSEPADVNQVEGQYRNIETLVGTGRDDVSQTQFAEATRLYRELTEDFRGDTSDDEE